uniref:DUF4148 domain-containing protein n=1 Tax=Globodera pallida TaxID=36090 RepID=A0A183CKK1_GLOPA
MDNRLIVDQSPKDDTEASPVNGAVQFQANGVNPQTNLKTRLSPHIARTLNAGGRSAYMFTGSAPGCESDDEKAQAIAREIALERAGRQGLTPKRWEEAVAKLINKQKNEQMNC